MSSMPSIQTLSALLAKHGEFKLSCSFPPPASLGLPDSPLEAVPLPFRRFLGGKLQEGGFAFVWNSGSSVDVLGIMQDSDVFSNAAPRNDRTWEKGDVFELFIQPAGSEAYFEIHSAPNGAELELRIVSIEDFRHCVKNNVNAFPSRLFNCGSHIEARLLEGIGWAAFISVPLDSPVFNGSCSGAKINISRYNYNRPLGSAPELSAVVEIPERVKSFHCPELWIPLA